MITERADVILTPQAERLPIAEQREKVRDVPVTIVIPPSSFLADERVFPFIGPLKVAAELEANGNPVEVLDLSGYENFLDVLDVHLESTNSNIFALTATTPQYPAAVAIARKIEEENPTAQIILGGPHATLAHTSAMSDREKKIKGRGHRAFAQILDDFDTVVVGDGEQSVFYAIDPEADQIVDAGNRLSPLFMQRGTLDNYHLPARHLIDHNSYRYHINDEGETYRAFSVIAQLGCPFGCGFCGGRESNVFRIARTRSIQNVVSEIETVVLESQNWEEPLRGVMFYDDELNVNPGALEELCLELIDLQDRLDIDMRFRGFVKAELFTQEQAELMYRAGFRILLTGIESGSDQILAAIGKGTSRETNSRCVRYAHEAGLKVKALMSLGHPGESDSTIKKSAEWVKSNLDEGDEVDWTIITQYLGTPYYDESEWIEDEHGGAWCYTVNGERLWSRELDYSREAGFYKGIPGEYISYVWTDHMSPEMLVEARDAAEEETRAHLNLEPVSSMVVAARQFDHSMGQLAANILRAANY